MIVQIFVADGHGPRTNARIVRFAPDGTFIRFWGRHGSGPEELEGPHALAMDSQGRLFVGDRTNNRSQIFDQDGTLLDSWTQFGRPSGLFIDQHDTLSGAGPGRGQCASPRGAARVPASAVTAE